MDSEWKTAITKIEPNLIRIQGYAVADMMEHGSFADCIYLILTGKKPDPKVSRLLNAILISSLDHGVTPPSALASITSASSGAPMNAAIAAGLLSINRHHGAAIEGCMDLLQHAVDELGKISEMDEAATIIVRHYRDRKKRMPGYGHRLHTQDPRTEKLLWMAEEAGLAGYYVNIALALEEALRKETGKKLPLNVDGAMAAVLLELGVPKELGNTFFMMSRIPGLIAHIHEEQSRQKPMRKIVPGTEIYDGPDDRMWET